jgi:hypothetical protein
MEQQHQDSTLQVLEPQSDMASVEEWIPTPSKMVLRLISLVMEMKSSLTRMESTLAQCIHHGLDMDCNSLTVVYFKIQTFDKA